MAVPDGSMGQGEAFQCKAEHCGTEVKLSTTLISCWSRADLAMTAVSSSSGRLPHCPSSLVSNASAEDVPRSNASGTSLSGVGKRPHQMRVSRLRSGLSRRSLGDPRARHCDRGSGFAWARKQSQAVIVGRVSLEAAPSSACHDHAETVSILVNSRKRL